MNNYLRVRIAAEKLAIEEEAYTEDRRRSGEATPEDVSRDWDEANAAIKKANEAYWGPLKGRPTEGDC